MLFNSLDFAVFLPIVFVVYWFIAQRHLKLQNGLIVLASYYFYGSWDWRFLSLIIFSTLVDFSIGLALSKTGDTTRRKLLLWTSILVNLGFLGFFKYYNFFLDNFVATFRLFGSEIQVSTLNITLPVGISFYTFQTLSYTIDVYRRQLEPTRDIIQFAAFVSFFPQLVAGPIERATNLLPQFQKKRVFNYAKAVDGMRQILWGLFKKVVIADNCARFANEMFNNYTDYSGSTLLLGAIFFTFQIYGDFSGYSDIAIGTSRLFGFKLMQNFAFPYFSRDIAEFWRRWHISLSTWFRDYLYIPLGGSKGGTWMKVRNTFIIFLVSGFWHGANWTFIAWGALNAVYFLPLLLTKNNRNHIGPISENRILPSFRETLLMALTFCMTVLAWIFFRAENIGKAMDFIYFIFSDSFFYMPNHYFPGIGSLISPILMIILFLSVEWIGRNQAYALAGITFVKFRPVRWLVYFFVVFLMGMYMPTKESPFIYFQF